MNKFEQLISYIINENEAKAKALFHEIVISKSRDIYEGLQQGMGAESLGRQIKRQSNVIDGDETMESEEDFGDDTLDLGGEESGDDFGGGEEDFGDSDIGGEEDFGDSDLDGEEEFGDEEMGDGIEGEGDVETRVMDLEDALDELKSEFDALMAGDDGDDLGGEEDFGGDDMGDDEGGDDMGDDEGSGEESYGDEGDEMDSEEEEESASVYGESKSKRSPKDLMREYVDKVSLNWPTSAADGDPIGSGGTNSPINSKSAVISGKNDMGGTTKNIAQGGTASDKDSNTGPKKPSNAYTKGETKMGQDKYENSPGAATKGYKDKRTVKREQEGQTTKETLSVDTKSFNPGGSSGYKG